MNANRTAKPTELSEPTRANEPQTVYVRPGLFKVASAKNLLRGPMINSPYRDLHNQWTTSYPH